MRARESSSNTQLQAFRRAAGRCVLAAGFFLLGPTSGALASPGPVTSPLSMSGRWIVDQQGRVAIVHGVAVISKDAPFYPRQFGEQDARFLANEGFTAARVGVIWAGIEPQPGRYDDSYIAHIVKLNDLLARYGIRTLIDFHQDLWRDSNGGDGAPAWATLGGNFRDDFQAFWDNKPASDHVGIQTHFLNAWRHVVQLLDASPGAANIIGWDPFNEPAPGTSSPCAPYVQPCPSWERGELADFYRRWITAIRAGGDRHLIFPEDLPTNGYAGQPSLPKFADSQTGFNFHYYCSAGLTNIAITSNSPADSTCPAQDHAALDNYLSYTNGLDVPPFLSEFGGSDADQEHANFVDLLGAHFVSWTYWAYYTKDPAGYPAEGLLTDDSRPGSEANAKQAKLDALVAPYPQAIAGTPESYSYDRTSDTMTLAYHASPVSGATLAADALTQIFVPARHYPHGYRVEVDGGRVVSSPTSPWIQLRAGRGAHVTVTVAPAAGSTTAHPLDVWRPVRFRPFDQCAEAINPLRRSAVGPVKLRMTRSQARRTLPNAALRSEQYVDIFCPGRGRLRVVYASPRLLGTISAAQRKRLRGRVVLILTSSRRAALLGVRAGFRVGRAARRLRLSGPYRIGATNWYVVRDGSVRGVLSVRRGVIREIGIAEGVFAATRRQAAILFGSIGPLRPSNRGRKRL